MIKASDRDRLLAFLDTQDLAITLEAAGCKLTFRESNCSKSVRAAGRKDELHYLLDKRMVELARDILHKRGELELS